MSVRRLCYAVILSASVLAAAQSRVTEPYPSRPVSDREKAFALTFVGLTLDQAKAALAAADNSLITVGSALALRDLAYQNRTLKPQLALAYYQEAHIIATRLNDQLLQGNLLFGEGDSYRYLGNIEAAIDAYDASFAAYTAAGGTPGQIALPITGRALARRAMGDMEGAIEDNQMVLARGEEAGDQVGIARALNNLGNVEMAVGRFQLAREYFERGLIIARAQKQRLGEAFLLTNIANAYLEEDNPELATDYCLQGLKIKEELGSTDDLVSSLTNLARIYRSAQKPHEANQVLERALILARASNRPAYVATVLAAEGGVAMDLKADPAALGLFKEALVESRKVNDQFHENLILQDFAEAEYDLKRYADSLRDAQAELSFATTAGMSEFIAAADDLVGRNQAKLGHLAEARAAFETSVAAYETVRSNAAGGQRGRSEFLAVHGDSYQALAALDVSQGHWEDALQISEREKGRALLDLLTQGKASFSNELTVAEKKEENRLRARLTALEADQQAAATATPRDPAHTAALRQQLQTAHGAMDSFKEHMSVVHPDLDRHRGSASLITLAQTATLLPESSTAILEFEVTPTVTYLFAISRGRNGPALHVYNIPIASSTLAARVTEFSKKLAARDPGFVASASALYRLLIAPAAADLAHKRSLIIVPSGDLSSLPFQALRNPSGRYLLEDAAISYAPSLSVLRTYAAQKRVPPATPSLLAFGDPGNNLPESAREVRTVATAYNPATTRILIGSAASKENFRANAAHYDVVHLATHGLFDDRDPMYSHLILAGSGTDPNQSRTAQLDASEIADMHLNAALVVLSACETADGQYRDGEGLVGLSWAFLAAGSQAAIASQWRVGTASTTDLMIAFHRSLQQKLSTSEALRRAELSIARTPGYDHPFYWAGFVLLGAN